MIFRVIFLSFLMLAGFACGSKDKVEDNGDLVLEEDGALKLDDSNDVEKKENTEKPKETAESPKKEAEEKTESEINEDEFVAELRLIHESTNTSEVSRAAAKVLEAQPKNVHALNGLAMHYFKAGRTGMARRILERALENHPQESSLYNNLGLIHLREDRQREAIAAFKKALQLDAKNAFAAKNLGSIYANFRDYKKAYPLLLLAYKKFPKDESVANNMAVTLKNLGKARLAKAVYEKRLADSDQPGVLYNYAVLLVNDLGLYQQGLDVIGKVQKKKLSGPMSSRLDLLEKKAKAHLK